MKVYKALKEKKKLINSILQLTELIQENNSIIIDNEFEFDIEDLLQQRKEKSKELINLKQRLAKTAVPIQTKIFELSELKLELQIFKNLDTLNGIISERYSDNQVTRKVQLSKVEVLERIDNIVTQIDNIQTEIDEFNYTTELV